MEVKSSSCVYNQGAAAVAAVHESAVGSGRAVCQLAHRLAGLSHSTDAGCQMDSFQAVSNVWLHGSCCSDLELATFVRCRSPVHPAICWGI